MKTRSYEKSIFILVGSLLSLVGEFILLLSFPNIKINQYKRFSMILVNKQSGYIIVKKEERKILYQNSQLYNDNKKMKYKIIDDQFLYEASNKKYYKIVLEIPKNEKYKENEITEISIKEKKSNMKEITKKMWGGD